MARLTATQRRLDGILETLAEAVTVHDARGKVVFANPAAAQLLGLPDVRSVLEAEPSELFGIFEMRDAAGRDRVPGGAAGRARDPRASGRSRCSPAASCGRRASRAGS